MTIYEKLLDLLPVIYPKFYTAFDEAKNELVFLDTGTGKSINFKIFSDKTQCEAFVNHFHIFDKIGKGNYDNVVAFGKEISKNLLASLMKSFPNKEFLVYLQVSKDSTIVRFHQIWENEVPYFDVDIDDKNTEMFEFKTTMRSSNSHIWNTL